MEDETAEANTDALGNIPGIGPARKAALYAAGITTRAGLAQASVEQLISLTGMPRGQAEKALQALQATEAPALSAPSPQVAPPLQDEAMPATTPAPAPVPAPPADEAAETPTLPDDDQDPATAVRGMLDNAAFRAKTALSDASRVWGLATFAKQLTKLALILDIVTEQAANVLAPKASKRIAARIEGLSVWIEKSVSNEKPLNPKRRKRVRQRLKSERIEIEKAVLSALRRQSGKEIKAVKEASREPKRRQKRIKK